MTTPAPIRRPMTTRARIRSSKVALENAIQAMMACGLTVEKVML